RGGEERRLHRARRQPAGRHREQPQDQQGLFERQRSRPSRSTRQVAEGMGEPMIARFLLAAAVAMLAAQARTTLDIYVVDVEGGNATLFVTPAGESVLIDTGNLDGAPRDAARILDAARNAGLTRIDHLITTHWHADHFGGLAELARQIPIREFIDHGPNAQPNAVADQFLASVYPGLTNGAAHRVAKPGDRIPLKGVEWQIVASAGAVPKSP